jgi:DNA-3-methyladenine glycosylase I
MKAKEPKRCFWVNLKNPAYVRYHDEEWGVPCHDDRRLLEFLILESFQAGLSWECILNRRKAFRRAYDDYDLGKIARYGARKIASLMADAGLIRNRRKIEASIRNSRVFREIQREFGSFDKYLWDFCGGRVSRESCDERTTSPLSDRLSADLKRRGMRFVGSTTIYAYLQSVGVVNGHTADCFRLK